MLRSLMMFGPSSGASVKLAGGFVTIDAEVAEAEAEDSQYTEAVVEMLAGSFVAVPVQEIQYIVAAKMLG